ncbi:MAG: ATP-binding protein, partial [Cyanobacteria bacterium J06628_6]
MNLLANALDAIELDIEAKKLANETATKAQPYRIWISTQTVEQDCVEIRIRDNGIGLKEEIAPKVFDHFFTRKILYNACSSEFFVIHFLLFLVVSHDSIRGGVCPSVGRSV